MAKRVGNLYRQNCTYEQLYYAYLNAAKKKRYRPEVLEFTEHLESNLLTLVSELNNHTYNVGRYREFYITEPKRRLIMALPFRDRVVQWWLYTMLYPIFDKTFITDSYACREGKGTKSAVDRVQYMLQQTEILEGDWFYLKIDMAKYFYRVVHSTVLEIVERKIKDPEIVQLVKLFIDGDGTAFGLTICDNPDNVERINYRGMPIGNLTSQLLANIYLNELDQFCKHVLGIKHYVRYMDDVVILSSSKEELRIILKSITVFLETRLQLVLNNKTTIRPVSMGIQFVGCTIWPMRRTVRKTTSLRIKRNLKGSAKRYAVGKISYDRYNSTLQSYKGLLKYNDCYRFKRQLLEDVAAITKKETR